MSTNWVLPSYPRTFASTLPNFEESLPHRVNHEGVQNYVKSRGTLNIGDWAIEGRRTATPRTAEGVIEERNSLAAPPPKVLGSEALRNYTRSRSSTPNLIGGILTPPDLHHQLRVKREGTSNYQKNRGTQMKTLFYDYGKLPIPPQSEPHTQGEIATNLFYSQQKGTVGPILNNYGRGALSPQPIPCVKGEAAENNLRKSHGSSQILEHTAKYRPPTPDPNVKGIEAHINYDVGLGRQVNKLFYQYGKLPQEVQTVPKVKYDGVENFEKGQGRAMQKTLSQSPPSHRYIERPQPVPVWP